MKITPELIERALKADAERGAGRWEDMGTYWAWRGGSQGYCPPPTIKRLIYKDADCPWLAKPYRICIGVEDHGRDGSLVITML